MDGRIRANLLKWQATLLAGDQMTDATDEISLLDIAVFLAENWLALLILPLIVAGGAYAWASMTPTTYIASATLQIPAGPDGEPLDIDWRGLYNLVAEPRAGVESEFADSGISIVARADTAGAAENAAQQAYDEIVAPLVEQTQEMTTQDEAIIGRANQLLERTEQGDDDITAASAIIALEMSGRAQDRLSIYAQALQTLQQPADIHVSRSGARPALMAVGSWVAAGLVLLIILALRNGLRNAAKTVEGREKVQRIRTAFFLYR